MVGRSELICEDAAAKLIVVLCSAQREVRNERVATRVAMRSQPVGQSQTTGYARERFAHLPYDRIEIVTDGTEQVAIRQAIGAVRPLVSLLL